MKVELFSAGCRLCERTEAMLQNRFPTIELTVHRSQECVDGSCCTLAEEYGVRAVPSLVVDGQVVLVGLPGNTELAKLNRLFGNQGTGYAAGAE